MAKDLLLITGVDKISIINVNNYKLRIINIPEAGCIYGVCILNQNMLLTGDNSKINPNNTNNDITINLQNKKIIRR